MHALTHNDFASAYIQAALFSETDNDGDPLDANHDVRSIHPDTLAKMVADCAAFEKTHGDAIDKAECSRGSGEYTTEEQAGHDFWLTRNGHGAGFWDGDWPEPLATTLTDASKAFGECELYVGDDGKIYSH